MHRCWRVLRCNRCMFYGPYGTLLCHGKCSSGRPDPAHGNAGAPCAGTEDQRGLRKEMIGSVALNRSYYASHASASCAAAVAYTWALWHNLCHGKSSSGRPDLAHCNAGAPCARAVGLQCLRKEMIRSVALN